MSWTMAEPGQVRSEGTTRPTPLPERVGAKQRICSGPSWRRYSRPILPSTTPSSPSSPAALTSPSPPPPPAPSGAPLLASRAPPTHLPPAPATAITPPEDAILAAPTEQKRRVEGKGGAREVEYGG